MIRAFRTSNLNKSVVGPFAVILHTVDVGEEALQTTALPLTPHGVCEGRRRVH